MKKNYQVFWTSVATILFYLPFSTTKCFNLTKFTHRLPHNLKFLTQVLKTCCQNSLCVLIALYLHTGKPTAVKATLLEQYLNLIKSNLISKKNTRLASFHALLRLSRARSTKWKSQIHHQYKNSMSFAELYN